VVLLGLCRCWRPVPLAHFLGLIRKFVPRPRQDDLYGSAARAVGGHLKASQDAFLGELSIIVW